MNGLQEKLYLGNLDATKAKEKLGWKAEIHLEELIQEMVLSDLNDIKE